MASLTLTRELAQAIADDVAAGRPVEAAAERRGIARSTVWDWLRAGTADAPVWREGAPVQPDSAAMLRFFSEAVMRARAERECELSDEAQAAIADGSKSNAVVSKAALDLLRTHPAYRDRWGQHVEMVHSGTVQQQQVSVQLTPEQGRLLLEDLRARRALPAPDADV